MKELFGFAIFLLFCFGIMYINFQWHKFDVEHHEPIYCGSGQYRSRP